MTKRVLVALGAALFFGVVLVPGQVGAQEVNSATIHQAGMALDQSTVVVAPGQPGTVTGIIDSTGDPATDDFAWDWDGFLIGGPPGADIMMSPNMQPFRTGLPPGPKQTAITVSIEVPPGTVQGTYPLTIGAVFAVGEINQVEHSMVVNVVVGATASSSSGTPICIESDLVQTAPEAAELAANDQFRHGDSHYLIIGGPPTCTVHCLNGFDFNCDGETDDLCQLPTPLLRVKDVAACLARFAPATTPEAPPATTPAPEAAPATTSLALTGATSDVLFQAALGLIAVGAASSAVAVRRRSDL